MATGAASGFDFDLTPYQPDGWSDKVVVSTHTGDHIDDAIGPTDSIYLDCAWANFGSIPITGFFCQIFIDEVDTETFLPTTILNGNTWASEEDISIGRLPSGPHTIRFVVDYFNGEPESNETNNTYTKTITVGGGGGGRADLAPYQPQDWSDKIVVSTRTGDHLDSATLRPTDTLYVDCQWINQGTASINVPFQAKLYLGDAVKATCTNSEGLPLLPGKDSGFSDFELGQLPTGTYTLKIVVDSGNVVSESNENNNTYTKTITVTGGQADLTLYQPQGWSDKLVVSNVPGTHADTPLSSTDTLYIDWSGINQGTAATSGNFDCVLKVNGTERMRWPVAAPVNPNGQPNAEDYTLGPLPAGSYTLEIVLDAINTVAESNETNNTYSKIVTVVTGGGGQPELTPRTALAADWAEPNDSFDTARDLGSTNQSYAGLSIHQVGDQDWYKWTAPHSGILEISLTSTAIGGDLDLNFLNASGQCIKTSAGETSQEHLSCSVIAGQPYMILVNNHTFDRISSYELTLACHASQFSAQMASIDYEDGTSRNISYHFDSGKIYDNGVIELPDSAIVRAPEGDEGGTYRLVPVQAEQELETGKRLGVLETFNGATWLDVKGPYVYWGWSMPRSETWSFSMSFAGFSGVGEGNAASTHCVKVGVADPYDPNKPAPVLEASWDRRQTDAAFQTTLSLRFGILNGESGQIQWATQTQTFVGLNPETTHLSLSVRSRDGYTLAGYYAIGQQEYQLLAEHTLSSGPNYGMPYSRGFVWLQALDQQAGTDRPRVSVTAPDPAAAEAGADPGEFIVTRTGNTDEPLTVRYRVQGTATTEDYRPALIGTITLPRGSTQAVISITPADDTQSEVDETVTLVLLEDPQYALGASTTATVIIADNDAPASGRIEGLLWDDANGNGVREAAEVVLPDWTVNLDANGDGRADATVATDPSGAYSFTSLPAGTYRAWVTVKSGWEATAPAAASRTTSLSVGQAVSDGDFGVRKIPTTSAANYAVLFCGGGGPENNHSRYYNTLRKMYFTLVNVQKLDPANIYVCYADGTNPSPDQNRKQDYSEDRIVNSDMSFAQNVFTATSRDLRALLSLLSAVIDRDDHFLFWSFDHGGGWDDPTIKGEEVLCCWDPGDDILGCDLASWLGAIHAGYSTYVFNQCYAGGMLDSLLPLGSTRFGCSAANHYEPSVGTAFAAPFVEALGSGCNTTYQAYRYALANDQCATNGEGPGGTARMGVEHPWARGGDFPIFARQANHSPDLTGISILDRQFTEAATITYDDLLASAKVSDLDGDSLLFTIMSVLNGTLTKDGEPVQPGVTSLSFGETVVWRPPANSSGGQDAFTIAASDGRSTSRSVLPVYIGHVCDNALLAAHDDHCVIQEDASDCDLAVLGNDSGRGNLRIVRIGSPGRGVARLVNGRIQYTPFHDFFGTDSLTYIVTDDSGEAKAATVSIEVKGVSDPPFAAYDSYHIDYRGGAIRLDVLDNDYDPDGDAITLLSVQSPTHGMAQVIENAIYYTPAANSPGVDDFSYTISDGQGHTGGATVHVVLAVEPTGNADAYEENDEKTVVDSRPEAGTNSPNLGILTSLRVIEDLTMDDAADWYRYRTSYDGIPANYINIMFTAADGDLDLELYSGDGATLVRSSTDSGTNRDYEVLNLNALPVGVYYIKVYGHQGASNPKYRLTIQPPTGPDPFEDNDSRQGVDSRPEAVTNSPNLGLLTQVQTIRSLTLEDMEDWYRFRMNGSGGAANYVQIDGDVGNAILSVYKSDGASLVGEVSRQSETTRKVSLTGLPPGVYYVRVWGGGGSTGYNLTIAPAAGVMPDRTPPTAKVTAANVSKGGATIYKFSVIYNDSNLLNTGTVGDGDILVTGPRKYKQVAKLVSKKPSRNAKSINAVYSVPAPGGKWDSNDNGTYVLWMQPKQVADTAGNFVAGKRAKLTSFDVRIPSSTTRSTSRAAVSREVAHTQVFSDTGIQPLLSINSNAYLHRRLPLFDLFAAHPGVDICTCDGDRLACPKRERHSGEVHAE